MTNSANLRKGDQVIVLSGSDKGKTGSIERVLPATMRVVVAGINLRTKHLKKTSTRKLGGLERSAHPLHISNVGLLRPGSKNRATRIGFELKKDGSKTRVARQAANKEIK